MARIIFSVMRPTGKLHLGNYLGALENWVKLQEEYKCFFGVVDLHALTTGYDKTEDLNENTKEMLIDWFSAGIDPERIRDIRIFVLCLLIRRYLIRKKLKKYLPDVNQEN